MNMEGKEYLKHGDLGKLGKKLDVTGNHVSKVLNGVVKNARISEAIEKLIEKRKREIEVLVNDFDD